MLSNLTAEDVVKELGLVPHCEGGYFREIHRSGSSPMTTKGFTDLKTTSTFTVKEDTEPLRYCIGASGTNNEYESLTCAFNRSERRPDRDIRRNCLTTIYWMATKDQHLPLAINLSDHVHFYHGGAAFEYITYDPDAKVVTRAVLGPDLKNGEKLQVAVRGGLWKCGRLITESKKSPHTEHSPDFCLIGEAVAPGFDFHDFCFVTPEQLEDVEPEVQTILKHFLHNDINKVGD